MTPKKQIKELVEWKRDCSNGKEHLPECQGCEDVCVLTRGELEKLFTDQTYTENKFVIKGGYYAAPIGNVKAIRDEGTFPAPQEPQEQCDKDYLHECQEGIWDGKTHFKRPVPQGESWEGELQRQLERCFGTESDCGEIHKLVRQILSRERQSVIQILEEMLKKGFGSCMDCTEGNQALREAISRLSERKGQ